jgi:E3 SUMO-protein ligase PIAS1
VKNNTVDRLKHIATGLNEQCAAHIVKSGKKQDLIDRIVARMESWRRNNQYDKWTKARQIFNQVRDNGVFVPLHSLVPSAHRALRYDRMSSYSTSSPSPSTYAPGPQSLNAYAASNTTKLTIGDTGSSSLPTTALPKYDPYAPPRKLPSAVSHNSGPPSTKPISKRFVKSLTFGYLTMDRYPVPSLTFLQRRAVCV